MPAKVDKTPDVDIVKEVAAAAKALAPAAKRLNTALAKLDPKKLPQGAVADLLYDLTQNSKLLGSVTAAFDDVLPPVVKRLQDYFIDTLKAGESSGVQGMKSRVQVTDKPVPQVAAEDWPVFYAYIRKNNAFELLNRAPNAAAIKERLDNKKQVPGVTIFHAKKVSCTKLSGGK